jgi:hypothetical protein
VNRQSNPDAKWLGPRDRIVKLIVGMADEDMKVGKRSSSIVPAY